MKKQTDPSPDTWQGRYNAWHGNWRMMVYWLAAATPNASVTYTGAAK